MTIKALKCLKCKDIIFSRAKYDFRSCSCGEISVDGGLEYQKISYNNKLPATVKIEIAATKQELFKDWNERLDKFGIIRDTSGNE